MVMALTSYSIGGERSAFSVIVPAFNEGPSIAAVLERLITSLGALETEYAIELIVVNDGSSDNTGEVLAAFALQRPGAIRLCNHERNRGLEQAIITGCRAATSDSIVLLDADLSYAPEIVAPLVGCLHSTGAAAVIASPYMRGGRFANVPTTRLVASRIANFLLSLCVGGTIKTFTGMVRAYDARVLLPILSGTPQGEFNTWIVAELLARGQKIVEIPAALIWPPERAEAAPRLTFAALKRRSGQVVASVGALRKGYRLSKHAREVDGT
jgi:glycosyltransferase involved in cell wall biosynthesis